MRLTKTCSAILFAICGLGISAGANAASSNIGDTNVTFSGYIKADAIFSDYSDGSLAAGNLGRDFYIPSLTPVGGNAESTQFDAHIRQSRFRFTTTTPKEEGDSITGVLEFDMLVTPGGNERVSNSYLPRMRHAFIKYKGFTVGQTWSTFMDVGALPEAVDFIGNADGTIFSRQALLRYTTGSWEFAVENPETTITPFGGGGRIVGDDSAIPDFIARYTHKADWGYIKLAGLARQLAYNNGVDIDTTESSYGISLNSKISVGEQNDIRISINSGVGLGRYSALNAATGGVLNAQGEIETIDSSAFSVAYRHVWNKQFRSNFIYAAFSADNNAALTGQSVTAETQSARVNLMYQPTAKITIGGEYTFAKREIESGADGDMNRMQFSMKYAF
ncbi:MAG: hypothetical protein ACJAVV_001086 [Alphaproteobacteria bacterium]|jgi:hypothetical protein